MKRRHSRVACLSTPLIPQETPKRAVCTRLFLGGPVGDGRLRRRMLGGASASLCDVPAVGKGRGRGWCSSPGGRWTRPNGRIGRIRIHRREKLLYVDLAGVRGAIVRGRVLGTLDVVCASFVLVFGLYVD